MVWTTLFCCPMTEKCSPVVGVPMGKLVSVQNVFARVIGFSENWLITASSLLIQGGRLFEAGHLLK